MVTAYIDPALGTLRTQLEKKHPGIVIGWIAGPGHAYPSDHFPEADGSVDAIDPMLGGTYSHEEAQRDVDQLVASRDYRIHYLIWNRRIISSVVQPWVWRAYTLDDPHTGHWHLSRNDIHESDDSPWKLGRIVQYENVNGSLPVVKYGDRDPIDAPHNVSYWVGRVQLLAGSDKDGDYGPKTAAAVKEKCPWGDGRTVGHREWARLMALAPAIA